MIDYDKALDDIGRSFFACEVCGYIKNKDHICAVKPLKMRVTPHNTKEVHFLAMVLLRFSKVN